MRIFLDTSVLLSASASASGASREIFRLAPIQGWSLLTNPYATNEVIRNLGKLNPSASITWNDLRGRLLLCPNALSLDRPVIFSAAKDRPILFSALAWADVLLTLDLGDFEQLLGGTFYGLSILKPGDFLRRERAAGRISPFSES